MTNHNSKGMVVVAMSGGVDSSVTAALLRDEGYDVVGLTLKLWPHVDATGRILRDSGCCSLEAIDDARLVCHHLGIPHYTVNMQEGFEKYVVSDFIGEYLKGRTPNPCIQCNIKIKWAALRRKAKVLGAGYFATGHYARVEKINGRHILRRAADPEKDQSYVLWGLSREYLEGTLFPLGVLKKSEVRRYAEQIGLRTAQTPDSQEICFVGEGNYKGFLERQVDGLRESVGEGAIVTAEGEEIGRHGGYPFYTIGQRKGLGVAVGKPVYVYDIDPESNTVRVGDNARLFARRFTVRDVNWISIEALKEPMGVTAQIRYNSSGASAIVRSAGEGSVEVNFHKPQRAITPGQSAVFYQGDVVVGGGIIERVAESDSTHDETYREIVNT